MHEKISILGINVDFLSMAETVTQVRDFLKSDSGHQIITFNPEMAVRAQKDREFKEILTKASFIVPDGIGLVWARNIILRKTKKQLPKLRRITGIDLIHKLVEVLGGEGKFFLFGGKHKIAINAGKNLIALHPSTKITGTEFGYVYDDKKIVEKINKAKPNILLVATGSPKQEKWIANNLRKMPSVKIAIGVGGALDFLSGKAKRAPIWMRDIGLEWFWRLSRQPWRVKRTFQATIIFPCLILFKEVFKKKC